MTISKENQVPNITIEKLKTGISDICNEDIVGFYLHGSLAMGCFNPNRSDVDVLVVTNKQLSVETKRKLAHFLVDFSNSPYPIEISFLNKKQLQDWQHPCPYDFHYSEDWRIRYEVELQKGTSEFINNANHVDPDLAAHITILNHRGICLEGEPIDEVFPSIPKEDYLSSIMGDFKECLENIIVDPIYCSLNLLRVYWYLKEGVISSKLEAGEWGLVTLPYKGTIQKVMDEYSGRTTSNQFSADELLEYKQYIVEEFRKLDRNLL